MQNLTLGSAFLHPASFVLLRHQLREQVERNWGRGISWGARDGDLTISSTPSHSISRHTNLEYKLLTVFLDSNAGTPFVFRDLPIRVLVAIPRHRRFLVSSLSERGKASGQSLLANMSYKKSDLDFANVWFRQSHCVIKIGQHPHPSVNRIHLLLRFNSSANNGLHICPALFLSFLVIFNGFSLALFPQFSSFQLSVVLNIIQLSSMKHIS